MKSVLWENVRIYYEKRGEVSLCPDELLETVRQKKILYARKEEQKQQQRENGSFLRNVLKEYLGELPDGPMNLQYNCYGKPYLVGNPCFFSLSHSGDLLVCAVSEEEVGADCEKIHQLTQNLAKKVLNESELAEYEQLPNEQKNDWMIRTWTVKESISKLLGTGIRTPKNLRQEDYALTSFLLEDSWITAAKNR